MSGPITKTAGAAFGALLGLAMSIGGTTAVVAAEVPTYEGHVQCDDQGKNCKIDLWMTRGYRAFSQCQVCHGLDGSGSTIAPSLLDKMKEIDHDRFVHVVTDGYQGQVGVMPAWGGNPNVMNYIDQLYAYLMARADGVLPGGKLQRYDR